MPNGFSPVPLLYPNMHSKSLHGINEYYLFPAGRIYVFQIQDYQKHHNSSPSMHLSVLVAMNAVCPKWAHSTVKMLRNIYIIVTVQWSDDTMMMDECQYLSAPKCVLLVPYYHRISIFVMTWSDLGPCKSPTAPASVSSPLEINIIMCYRVQKVKINVKHVIICCKGARFSHIHTCANNIKQLYWLV